jgi:hypothetical protein
MCPVKLVMDIRQKRKSEIRNMNFGLCEEYEKKKLVLNYVNITVRNMILMLSMLSQSLYKSWN